MDLFLKIVLCVPAFAVLATGFSNITSDMICGDNEYYQTHQLTKDGKIMTHDECLSVGTKFIDDSQNTMRICGGLAILLIFVVSYVGTKIYNQSQPKFTLPKNLNDRHVTHCPYSRDALPKYDEQQKKPNENQ